MDKTAAILARTNRALRPFEEVMSRENVKYHLLGKSGFWSQPECRAVVAYAQCALFPADYAIAGATRAFWPTKFLPKTKLLSRLKDLQKDREPSYWHMLTKEPHSLVEPKNLGAVQEFVNFIHSLSRYKDLPAPEALRSIMGALRVGDEYSDHDDPDNSPLENLADLLKLSARHSSLKEFLDWTRRASAASKGKKGVALGTIHSSKGLEFSHVYLVSLNDGILPHAKSDDLESERAVFFVGASRAERELTLSFSGIPSPFLKGIPCDQSLPS